MPQEKNKELENEQIENEEKELTDDEIAELANKEIGKKNAEIAKLKKENAKLKLYQNPVPEKEKRTREDIAKVLNDSKTNNYDYAQAVIDLCSLEEEEGHENPMGEDGDAVVELFQDCIDCCDGDKSKFTAIYQSKIANDDKKTAMAYQRLKNKNS